MRTRLFNGGVETNGGRDYKGALIDSGIVAGFTFFSALAGLGATGLLQNGWLGITAATISTGVSFFSSLMTSLNIKKPR